MSHIIDDVWIGDWRAGLNEHALARRRIRNVICVHPQRKTEDELLIYARLNISHHHFALGDIVEAPIHLIFDKCMRIIDTGPTLIHCAEGRSQSATIAAVYLILHRNMQPSAALDYCHERSPGIEPNPGFQKQLDLLYKRLLEKPVPATF
jgi:protein-tyrosine phosphatase